MLGEVGVDEWNLNREPPLTLCLCLYEQEGKVEAPLPLSLIAVENLPWPSLSPLADRQRHDSGTGQGHNLRACRGDLQLVSFFSSIQLVLLVQ